MSASRRFLPSMNALVAFEAMARTKSVTRAAEELSLTQSAVSRQLLNLEKQLGAELFVREKKRLQLTPEGEAYAAKVQSALQSIAQASLALSIDEGSGVLEMAILPTFGTRWLAPKLGEFAKQHPEVSLNLSTRLKPVDLEAEGFDAAIVYGDGEWGDYGSLMLMSETLLPVMAPDLKQEPEKLLPEDLLSLPLLHMATRQKAWEQWFGAQGLVTGTLSGMKFDQFATMAQAVAHGLGIALMPEFLIEQELKEGKLVVATSLPKRSMGAYYLIWPESRAQFAPLVSFRNWLEEMVNV